MELTNNETNIQTILGGPGAMNRLLRKASKEGWSERRFHTELLDRNVTISLFGARSLLLKWRAERRAEWRPPRRAEK